MSKALAQSAAAIGREGLHVRGAPCVVGTFETRWLTRLGSSDGEAIAGRTMSLTRRREYGRNEEGKNQGSALKQSRKRFPAPPQGPGDGREKFEGLLGLPERRQVLRQ